MKELHRNINNMLIIIDFPWKHCRPEYISRRGNHLIETTITHHRSRIFQRENSGVRNVISLLRATCLPLAGFYRLETRDRLQSFASHGNLFDDFNKIFRVTERGRVTSFSLSLSLSRRLTNRPVQLFHSKALFLVLLTPFLPFVKPRIIGHQRDSIPNFRGVDVLGKV